MSKFVLKKIYTIKGKLVFKQLVILDDLEDINKIQHEITEAENEDIECVYKGVLDWYEEGLEKRYIKSLQGILSIMDRIANMQLVSKDKFRDVTPDNEKVKEYEFKFGDLRVYAIKIPNGQLVILAGYKNTQKKDFKQFRSLKNQYLYNLKDSK